MQIKNTDILLPECFYHIYSRAAGDQKLFLSEENYRYFLEKYFFYISPLADTYCYCLMPNHFHFLIRIQEEQMLADYFQQKNGSALTGLETLSGLDRNKLPNLISQQFSHLLNGYTQAFNKQNSRKGGLFMRPFKRIQVTDERYRNNLVHYIHHNPVAARLCKTPAKWPHSSYNNILSDDSTFLGKEEVTSWFGSRENFQLFHSQAANGEIDREMK